MKTLTALIVLLMSCQVATAQSNCAPREVVVERLATGYSEARQSIGLAGNNTVVETFASESGSWTVIVTRPSGISCLVASGQAFQLTVEDLPTDGDDA